MLLHETKSHREINLWNLMKTVMFSLLHFDQKVFLYSKAIRRELPQHCTFLQYHYFHQPDAVIYLYSLHISKNT